MTAPASTIPWVQRQTTGRVRAYFRTVSLSIVRPGRLAGETEQPVSFRDALLFRRITAALATFSVIAAALIFIGWIDDGSYLQTYQLWRYEPEWLGLPVYCAAIWFFFLTAAGVGSYWFHPRSRSIAQQNRAIAISYYAAGPLALTPLLAMLLLAMLILAAGRYNRGSAWTALGLGCGVAFVMLVEVVTLWRATLILLRRTTRCGLARQVSLGLGLLLAWFLLAVLFLIVIPRVYSLLAIMVLSFH